MTVPTEGKVQAAQLAAMMAELIRAKATGTLRFERDTLIKVLYLKNGALAYASSNEDRDRLGSVLIRAGKISREQLDEATAKVETGKTLGKTLTEMGFITPEDLLSAAKTQVEDIFGSLFTWSDGSFEWLEGKLPEGLVDLRMPGAAILLKGMLAVEDDAFVTRETGGAEAVYNFTDSFMNEYEGLALPESVDTLIANIDGERSVRELARMSRDEAQARKILWFCRVFGLLHPVAGAVLPEDVPTVKSPEPAAAPPAAAAKPHVAPPPEPPPPSPALQNWLQETKAARPATDMPLAAAPPDDRPSKNLSLGMDAKPAGPSLSLGGTPSFTPPPQDKFKPVFNVERPKSAAAAPSPGGGSRFGRLAGIAIAVILILSTAAAGLQFWLKKRGISLDDMMAGFSDKPIMETLTLEPEPPVKTEPAKAPEEGKVPSGENVPTIEIGPAPPREDLSKSPEEPAGSAPVKTEPKPAPETKAPVKAAEPAPKPAPKPETRPEPVAPPASSLPFPRDAEARRLLREGKYASAAKIWKEDIAKASGTPYTVLLAILCEESSLRRAAEEAGGSGLFFCTPTSFKGRSCYRAAWGVFSSRAEAERAYQSMPAYFREMSHKPQIGTLAGMR